MQPNQEMEKTKKQYEKPRLRTIELAAEEVLGVGCKMASGGGGPSPPTCQASSCIDIGS